MSHKILFISDYFRDDIIGGAELNDNVLINYLENNEYSVIKKRSTEVSIKYLSSLNKEIFVIISNFVGLSEESKTFISKNLKYIIYEHDHKYVSTRDPSKFANFEIPEKNIINLNFYKKAKNVVVLSKVCKEILQSNLGIANVINIGTSLWSKQRLETLKKLSKTKKIEKISILQSENPIKGTQRAVEWCKQQGLEYNLISSSDEERFLEKLSKSEKLIFFPVVLETFSRLVAEAKMLNCKVITNPNLIGFASEEIYDFSGSYLNEKITERVQNALKVFLSIIQDEKEVKKTIAFIGKFKRIHDEEGKARSLEYLGHTVYRFDEDTFNKVKENSLETLLSTTPDIVIFTKLRVPNAENIIEQCRKRGITTVSWMPDLYFGLERQAHIEQAYPMFRADYVLSPDGGNDKNFKKYDVNHHCVRQGIDYWSTSCEKREKNIDILFVGTCGKNHGEPRREMLHFLQDTYKDRFVWIGKSGPEEMRGENLSKIIQSSKIVIGTCVLSDFYWSNRVYETMGRGGFLLHPMIPGLNEEIQDGKHFCSFEYGNMEDLKNKIDFYLSPENEENREKIRINGFEYVKKNHSLINRAKQVMEILSRKEDA